MMAQKSKAAALTGSLLAPKGTAEPAAPSGQPEGGQDAVGPVDAADRDSAHEGGIQFPLRLDPSDHLELRLAAARLGKSCQELITEALARYLAEIAAESGDGKSSTTGGAQ